MSSEIEERLRKLEIGYTEIKGKVTTIAGDIRDIKETLKELAYIAKAQIELNTNFKAFEKEQKTLNQRIELLEKEISFLKKIAYSAIAIAGIGAPVLIEILKSMFVK